MHFRPHYLLSSPLDQKLSWHVYLSLGLNDKPLFWEMPRRAVLEKAMTTDVAKISSLWELVSAEKCDYGILLECQVNP